MIAMMMRLPWPSEADWAVNLLDVRHDEARKKMKGKNRHARMSPRNRPVKRDGFRPSTSSFLMRWPAVFHHFQEFAPPFTQRTALPNAEDMKTDNIGEGVTTAFEHGPFG